jgi:hypothetical protein
VLSHAQLHAITIRPASDRDERSLRELAALDSAAPLAGDVLLAESDAAPVAALELRSGRIVADPFRRTANEANLLRAVAGTAR